MHEVATARETNPDDRVSKLEAELAKLRGDYSRLHHMYTRTLEELELVRRRMFIAKAERVDTSADQLAFHGMFDQIEGLRKALEIIDAANGNNPGGKPDGRKKKKHRPTGRRDLSKTPLPVQRVEVVDPMLEGVAKRIGVEESQRVVFRRGGRVRLVIARVVYKRFGDPCCAAAPRAFLTMLIVARSGHREVCFVPSNSKATGIVAAGDLCQTSPAVCVPPRGAKAAPKSFQIVTAAMPKELFPRGLLAPSMIAHVLFEKYVMGVPFYRQEQQSAVEGFRIGRATMCRYAEHTGATLGAIVEAARKEAIKDAFCLSTDATGISIQPTPLEDGKERRRQSCRKGHFFVTLADRDHVFFDFQPKHTSAAVWTMFKGFSGYIQADAHTIYDALFRGIPPKGVEASSEERKPPPTEVGCWSHARRKFWEAAVCKHPVGLDGLRLIDKIFHVDRLHVDMPPDLRKDSRDLLVRPLVDAFFLWAKTEQTKIKERGLVASALGYALRQKDALQRFLDDGRLRLENNAAERALRTIAIGRNYACLSIMRRQGGGSLAGP